MFAISKVISLRHWMLATLLAVSLLDLAGCAAVRGRRGAVEPSGFLGDYSQLQEREGYEAQEVYVNPGAVWHTYRAVEIDSVTLWTSDETSKLSAQDGQMLTDLFYKALHEELGKRFPIAEHAGPEVIRIRAALTQAKGAKVAMRTVSTLVPQALLIGTAVGLAADTANTVGTATAEMEAVDSITGERLAAAIDEVAGTKRVFTTRTFTKWGDVEAACHIWAERLALFLVRQGVPQRPGAPAAS
jgi:hypothetical protein